MKNFTRALWSMVTISVVLWLLSKPSLAVILVNPMKSLAQVFAIMGATGYFVSFILSSRFPFFEKELSLDKSYKLHRIVGTLAGAGILLHVASLMTNLLPSPLALSLYLIPGRNLAYDMGIFTFYGLLITLITTLYLKLPYHVWKVIHKIVSYSILFAVLHLFLIPSDISTFLPLRIWMLGLAFAGLGAWLYREFIYPRVAFSHEYTVKEIVIFDQVSIITLTASKNPLKLEPGQFAFFKIYATDSDIPPETHPFTVLSANDKELMIAAKKLGDFTRNLHNLRVGTLVKVAGPHGSFGKRIMYGERPQVWIAGGIGITPFFNLAAYFASQKTTKDAMLYYSTTEQDKIFHPLLLNYTNSTGITYSYTCSSTSERLSPARVLDTIKVDCCAYDYFVCGPKGMLLSFISALKEAGVPEDQIFTEDFDFKSLDI